jgi:broad specificity phosphatase PhoE
VISLDGPNEVKSEIIQVVFIRHGKADHNGIDGNHWYNSNPEHPDYIIANLTEEGKEVVHETADWLFENGVTAENSIAFVSPLPRTQQTAGILSEHEVIDSSWITELKIIEVQAGALESKFAKVDANGVPFTTETKQAAKKEAGYETWESVAKRTNEFVLSLPAIVKKASEQKSIKNVVIISHDETLHRLIQSFGIDDASQSMIDPGKYRVFSVEI